LKNLHSLDLTNAVVSDYTPLKLIPKLDTIFCNGEQEKKIEEALGETNFKFVVKD
jgi:hypothetical protein